MAVWEDAKLASPHNLGTCWPLVGDPDAQGDGRNPQVNCQGSGEAPEVRALSPNHWTNRGPQTPGNIHWIDVSWRSSPQHQDSALPNSLQTPVLEASGQKTSMTGTQSHS